MNVAQLQPQSPRAPSRTPSAVFQMRPCTQYPWPATRVEASIFP